MLEIRSLYKEYHGHPAVTDLSWTLEDHGVYGFLGPNGAGKSTTMNIAAGCLCASSGDVLVDGCSIFEDPLRARRKIGYLPEIPPLYTDMTPREYLDFVAEMKGIPGAERRGAVQNVLERCSLVDVQDRLIRYLSKGYRQRVGIAQAVLGDPSLIILDEPMVGLDPAQISEIRELIRSLGERHTVLLSSHILPEIQAICKKVLIIRKGRMAAEGTPEELEQLLNTGEKELLLTVRAGAAQAKALLESSGLLFTMDGQDAGQGSGPASARCSFRVRTAGGAAEETAEKLFFLFAGAGIPILRCEYPRTDLEAIFLELTEKEKE